ncbi:MAG TPA: sugar ABC transporter permease [Clostridiales bacterium]|nr:sugar ABC transporter permease [Clostridiales bacterium]HPP36396.1 sugar ABC transporter permease [Clostridiales bacterium]
MKLKERSLSLKRREALNFYLYISPWLLSFLVLTIYPMLDSFLLSFTDAAIGGDFNFIGLENFRKAFTVDPQFWVSFRNTILYVLMYVPANLVISFFLGYLLSRNIKALGFFRTVFYIPYITSGVAVTVMWGWIFNGSYGLINYLLSLVGIQGPNWLADKRYALICIVIISLWSIGNGIIIMLAGIQDIPATYYESAQIDGASSLRQVFSITIPLTTPTIYFNLVIGIISAFQLFNQPYILTQGGPVNATRTVAMVVFQNAFQYGRMGYASCVAWVLFVVIMAVTLIIQSSSKRWVFYDN